MSLQLSGPSSSAPALSDEKQEALRRAGAEYFEKVLEQARKGKNALNEDPRSRKPLKDIESQDKDLETVGRVLPYITGLLFLISQSARLVLVKLSLEPLHTPAIQVFLHLLPAVCVTYALVDVGPLTGKVLRGSSVAATVYGVQILSLFGALNFGSLYLVLAWTTLVPPALAYYKSMMQQQPTRPGVLNALMVAIGVSGAALALLSNLLPTLLGSLCLCGWTVAEVAKGLWEQFKSNPETNLLQLGAGVREELTSIAQEESKVRPGAKTFISMAISAVPCLLTGFVCREGSDLVDHELSVPAVSNMLLSCGAWTVVTVTGIMLTGSLSEGVLQKLCSGTALGGLVLQVTLNGIGDFWALAGTLLAVVGGVGAQILQT